MAHWFRYIIFLFLLSFSTGLKAQFYDGISDAISDCEGSMNILEPGTFSVQFTGKAGRENDLRNYPSLESIRETNSLWFDFIAPFHGLFYIDASTPDFPLQFIVFQSETENTCFEISHGIAEIKRMVIHNQSKRVGLSKKINDNYLYPIELKAGERIKFMINSTSGNKSVLNLAVRYESSDSEDFSNEIKLVDKRKDTSNSSFKVSIRDITTGKPIVSNLTLNGIKELKALYTGSDFLFNFSTETKVTLACDVEGYFFADRTETLKFGEENEFTIWLEPLKEGKSLLIKEIEFFPGTSDFMPGADSKLRRLKEFLALNAEIHIEIQGHVFAIGENTYAAQKLSESRAKKVYNYLVENGIDKKRLTTIGYGNTRPIFANPKFAHEEQVNRRVEIKITKEGTSNK